MVEHQFADDGTRMHARQQQLPRWKHTAVLRHRSIIELRPADVVHGPHPVAIAFFSLATVGFPRPYQCGRAVLVLRVRGIAENASIVRCTTGDHEETRANQR